MSKVETISRVLDPQHFSGMGHLVKRRNRAGKSRAGHLRHVVAGLYGDLAEV